MSVKLQMRDDSFFFFFFLNHFCKIIDILQSLLCIFSSGRVVKVSGRVLYFSYMSTVFYLKHVQNLQNVFLPLRNICLQWSWWSSFCLSTIEMSVNPAWHGCKNNSWAKNSFQAWGRGISSLLNGRVGFHRSQLLFVAGAKITAITLHKNSHLCILQWWMSVSPSARHTWVWSTQQPLWSTGCWLSCRTRSDEAARSKFYIFISKNLDIWSNAVS